MAGIPTSTGAIYLTISDGKICQKVPNETETSVTRVTKSGKTVHEEFFKAWSGKITNVKTRDTDYGKEWVVEIYDGQKAFLSFNYSSGYASSFLKALPNVKLSAEVTITPNVQEVDGKKRTTIFLNQDNQPVKWFYTKDNPKGCPSMEKIKIKGVEQWDDSKMMEFLENKTAELFSDESPF